MSESGGGTQTLKTPHKKSVFVKTCVRKIQQPQTSPLALAHRGCLRKTGVLPKI